MRSLGGYEVGEIPFVTVVLWTSLATVLHVNDNALTLSFQSSYSYFSIRI